MKQEIYRSPPFDLKGYVAFTVKYSDGTKETVLEHREVMEEELGRSLIENEIVHHVDGDRKNNDIANLVVMSRAEHTSHHADGLTMYEFNCPWCGEPAERPLKDVKHNRKQGKAGPFCSRSCAGKWSVSDQTSVGEGKRNTSMT